MFSNYIYKAKYLVLFASIHVMWSTNLLLETIYFIYEQLRETQNIDLKKLKLQESSIC